MQSKNRYLLVLGTLLTSIALLISGCLTSLSAAEANAMQKAQATANIIKAASPTIPSSPTPTETQPTAQPTEIPSATISIPTETPTPRPAFDSATWQELPVIPPISERVVEIYQRGIAMGNNPQAFSKVGDCGSTPAWFLGDFDRGPKYYRLGEYAYLDPVIQYYQGSYARTSLAAKSGFNASSVFAPLWSNRSLCQPNESPLGCEYRHHQPILAFIMLGSNDVWHQDTFEDQMRKIIEYSIDKGVIPVLSTKADNDEGDGSINATIARLAYEYDIPLLNYWRAVQSLPNQGLQEDGVHITWGANRFDDPAVMKKGWPVRNLTALQMLDAVWRKVSTSS